MTPRKFTKAYEDARYELSLVDQHGNPIPGAFPWRFDHVLTEAEMRDGAKNGYAKYAVPMFDETTVPSNPQP